MKKSLPFRQIHLDFHTSEHIPEVGAAFDGEQFAGALEKACVDSVTVFARCHHGWCYYPSRVGEPHPNLKRPDLLGEMVSACRDHGIGVCVYLTVQWDERMAREHPEWRVMKAANLALKGTSDDRSAMNQLSAQWHPLCLNHEGYLDYVTRMAVEVADAYEPDGLFMDILLSWECVCPSCLASMQEKGLDPAKQEDRIRNDRDVLMNYYRVVSEAVWKGHPGMRLFHNSGHIYKGERDRYRFFSHLELESLPTGGWGYDHFPVSARYTETLGLEFLGMTGKFHTSWGEFGGYKRSVALEYECASMVANGARCSVGDQLHPSGAMDRATYDTIAPAYRRIEKIEPFLADTKPVSEIAILSAEACDGNRIYSGERSNSSDDGAARMLLELHQMFDVVDVEADFTRYRLLVLPDTIACDEALAAKLSSYTMHGGRLMLSAQSGLKPDGSAFAIDLGLLYQGQSPYRPDYIEGDPSIDPDLPASPFVVYERATVVRREGAEVLAGTRVPYFNRTWDHFCSHQHTPYQTERNRTYDAVYRHGNTIYFAHPIFRAYYDSGQPLLKYLFRGCLERILSNRRLHVELPSSGRVTLRSGAGGRLLLHLLYASTQARGEGLPNASSRGPKIEIIEDAVPLFNVACSVRSDSTPKRVFSAYSNGDLEFEYAEGMVRFVVPRLYLHELIVIE